MPTTRPTIASQLHGSQTLHNGHIVLGNSSLSPPPCVISPKTNGINGIKSQALALQHQRDQGGYAGPRAVQLERCAAEEKENLETLIDLLG